jgi:hypothetical protein
MIYIDGSGDATTFSFASRSSTSLSKYQSLLLAIDVAVSAIPKRLCRWPSGLPFVALTSSTPLKRHDPAEWAPRARVSWEQLAYWTKVQWCVDAAMRKLAASGAHRRLRRGP